MCVCLCVCVCVNQQSYLVAPNDKDFPYNIEYAVLKKSNDNMDGVCACVGGGRSGDMCVCVCRV